MKSTFAQIAELDPAEAVFEDPIKKNDEVVGTISDDLKRLWVFMEKMRKNNEADCEPLLAEMKTLVEEHNAKHQSGEHTREECIAYTKKGAELAQAVKQKRRLYRQAGKMFWAAVELELGITEDLSLSIRQGGVIVKNKNEEDEDPIAGLAKMLGGLGGIIQVSIGTPEEAPSGAV